MTLFNRLSRLFGGHTAIILVAPACGKKSAGHGDVPRENMMINDSLRAQLQLASE